jgi:4-amino-4-deoxy-L-arabinose transferase-like glycosyltransferase
MSSESLSHATANSQGGSERGSARTDVLVLVVVFFLSLLPYAASFVLMYPDENDYLDGGVLMCQNHDYLMPAWPNDLPPDFIKPILTYWIVTLSYKLFGFSLAAARVPFLLAGAAIIWTTHRLVSMLTTSDKTPEGSRAAATLSCVVLLGNPLFWLSALRCLPDIWLCLFLLASAYGFLGLLTDQTSSSWHALLAYGGFGLAVLAKGVPGVIFLGYALAFGCCNPWLRGAWRRVVHLPGMAVGVLVAVSWFVVVYFTHGTDNLKGLWSDQVAGRMVQSRMSVVVRFPQALAELMLTCLPWYWPLCRMGRRWRELLPAAGTERLAHTFIVPWILLTLLMTSATYNFSIRYALPILPLLAIVVGMALARVDTEILDYCCRRLLALVASALVVVVLASLVLCWQLNLTMLEWALGLVVGALVLFVAASSFSGHWLRPARGIAVVCLSIIAVTYLPAAKIVRPEMEEQIAGNLQLDSADQAPVAVFIGSTGPASRLRIALAPRVKLMQWLSVPAATPASRSPDDLPTVLVLPERSISLLGGSHRYELHAAGSVFDSPPGGEMLSAICRGQLRECLLRHRLDYTIAVRCDETGEWKARAQEVENSDLASHPLLQRERGARHELPHARARSTDLEGISRADLRR